LLQCTFSLSPPPVSIRVKVVGYISLPCQLAIIALQVLPPHSRTAELKATLGR
jgi:hypothetical protein